MTITRTRPPELISPELFASLVCRVATDENVDDKHATRIVNQTVAFLECCALHPNAKLVPSQAVDAGWHAFLLHTRQYAEFCDRVAGWFIHHQPTNGPGGGTAHDTVRLMTESGLDIDNELWNSETKCRKDCEQGPKCHQCHAGCHDSP